MRIFCLGQIREFTEVFKYLGGSNFFYKMVNAYF